MTIYCRMPNPKLHTAQNFAAANQLFLVLVKMVFEGYDKITFRNNRPENMVDQLFLRSHVSSVPKIACTSSASSLLKTCAMRIQLGQNWCTYIWCYHRALIYFFVWYCVEITLWHRKLHYLFFCGLVSH